MGREYSGRRHMKIKQSRKRRKKLRRLRVAYQSATDEETKKKIVEKIRKISPSHNLPNEI